MNPDIQKTIKRLKSVLLFAYLPDDVLAELAERAQTLDYAPNTVLFRKGDEGDAMYFLRSGWVKLVAEGAEGDEIILAHCGPGEPLNDIMLIDGEPCTETAMAATPAGVLRISRGDFMEIIDCQPALAIDVMRGLASRIRTSTLYVEKAIAWSQRVAQGDYGATLSQVNQEHTSVTTRSRPEENRVGEFLASFQGMVEEVQKREETLKNEIQELKINVDASSVKKDVSSVTDTDFFEDLKVNAERWRSQRKR